VTDLAAKAPLASPALTGSPIAPTAPPGTNTTQIATTAFAAAALAAHEAAADPHTGYQRETEKGAANGYASLGATSLVPPAQLGTGTANSTRFLRGDGAWQVPTASLPDSNYGDVTVASGVWSLNADTVGLAELDTAAETSLRDRSTHTGTQLAATVSDFTEAAQDAVGPMLRDGTHTGISFAYDDPGGKLNATVTGGGGGVTDAAALTYTSRGTGAFQRMMKSAADDMVSLGAFVAANAYTGNSRADQGLQNAIDYMAARSGSVYDNHWGGGTIYIPDGAWRIDATVEMKSRVKLWNPSKTRALQGPNPCVFITDGSLAAGSFMFHAAPLVAMFEMEGFAATAGLQDHGFIKIDSNYGGHVWNNLSLYAFGRQVFLVTNGGLLTLKGVYCQGIMNTALAPSAPIGAFQADSILVDSEISDCEFASEHPAGDTNGYYCAMAIKNGWAKGAIQSCVFQEGNTGLWIHGSGENGRILNNRMEYNYMDGLILEEVTDTTFAFNAYSNNSRRTAGTYSHIHARVNTANCYHLEPQFSPGFQQVKHLILDEGILSTWPREQSNIYEISEDWNNQLCKYAADVPIKTQSGSDIRLIDKKKDKGTAIPTTGIWPTGWRRENTLPVVGGYSEWECIQGGYVADLSLPNVTITAGSPSTITFATDPTHNIWVGSKVAIAGIAGDRRIVARVSPKVWTIDTPGTAVTGVGCTLRAMVWAGKGLLEPGTAVAVAPHRLTDQATKVAAYTLAATDTGTRIPCSHASTPFTVTVPSAATLGNGFSCELINIGVAAVTIDGPGATNITLSQHEACYIYVTGGVLYAAEATYTAL
jgi:hypothetical protein